MRTQCHQADDSPGAVWATTLYPGATVLVRTLVISHCLFFADMQSVLICWDGARDNGKERLKLKYSLNKASTGLGN